MQRAILTLPKQQKAPPPAGVEGPERIANSVARDTGLDITETAQLQRLARALWASRNAWDIERHRQGGGHA